VDPDSLILIVTGSHPRAEAADRPLAYLLRERMRERLAALQPLVCSDLWYLNNDALRARPTVSVGGPAVNAFSAFLGDKLPSVFAIDGELMIQLDPESPEHLACCWGANAEGTERAVGIFIDRYLDTFLDGVAAEAA